MAKLLQKYETKKFDSIEELKDFTALQEASYKWNVFKTSDGNYSPLEDMPILVSIIRDKLGVSPDVSDDTIREQMADTKLMLTYPVDESSTCTYPVGPTAYRSVLARLGATCPALTALTDTRARNEVNPVDKAQICNVLTKYAKGSSCVLVGDELVLANLSNDYVRLPFTQLLSIMEEEIKNLFEYVQFYSGYVSHETSSAEFMFMDDEIDSNMYMTFKSLGIDISSYHCHIKVITSDVGLSGVNVFPFIRNGAGHIFSIGTPIKLEHIGDANMDKFRNNLLSCFASFKDVSENLEKMKLIKISNPADCFYNVGKKVLLPDKILKEMYEEFNSEYPYHCSGIDVYCKLFDALDVYASSETVDDLKFMQMNENITRVCFYSLHKFDEPVIYK